MYPVEPHDSFGFELSVVWVFLLGSIVTALFAFAMWRFIVFRRRTLDAQTDAKKAPSLQPGRTLLSGKAETDDGSAPVRIEIRQKGTETQNKNSWSHEWKEVDRKVLVQPFRLRLASDEAILVVPDDRIHLVDALGTESFHLSERRRVAEVQAGESIWVSGVLTHEGSRTAATTAYRSGPGSLVLRGTRTEPLEIASGTFEAQFSYWRRFYGIASILLGLLFAVTHGVFFMSFYALAISGEVETASITRTSTYITKSKNKTTTHYVIHAELPGSAGGHAVKDDVSFYAYEAAREGKMKETPFIYVPKVPSIHAIGVHATQSIGAGIISLIATIMSVIAFLIVRRGAMPWYEQSEVIERGSGRLPERAWHAQIPGKPGLYEERAPPPTATKS